MPPEEPTTSPEGSADGADASTGEEKPGSALTTETELQVEEKKPPIPDVLSEYKDFLNKGVYALAHEILDDDEADDAPMIAQIEQARNVIINNLNTTRNLYTKWKAENPYNTGISTQEQNYQHAREAYITFYTKLLFQGVKALDESGLTELRSLGREFNRSSENSPERSRKNANSIPEDLAGRIAAFSVGLALEERMEFRDAEVTQRDIVARRRGIGRPIRIFSRWLQDFWRSNIKARMIISGVLITAGVVGAATGIGWMGIGAAVGRGLYSGLGATFLSEAWIRKYQEREEQALSMSDQEIEKKADTAYKGDTDAHDTLRQWTAANLAATAEEGRGKRDELIRQKTKPGRSSINVNFEADATVKDATIFRGRRPTDEPHASHVEDLLLKLYYGKLHGSFSQALTNEIRSNLEVAPEVVAQVRGSKEAQINPLIVNALTASIEAGKTFFQNDQELDTEIKQEAFRKLNRRRLRWIISGAIGVTAGLLVAHFGVEKAEAATAAHQAAHPSVGPGAPIAPSAPEAPPFDPHNIDWVQSTGDKASSYINFVDSNHVTIAGDPTQYQIFDGHYINVPHLGIDTNHDGVADIFANGDTKVDLYNGTANAVDPNGITHHVGLWDKNVDFGPKTEFKLVGLEGRIEPEAGAQVWIGDDGTVQASHGLNPKGFELGGVQIDPANITSEQLYNPATDLDLKSIIPHDGIDLADKAAVARDIAHQYESLITSNYDAGLHYTGGHSESLLASEILEKMNDSVSGQTFFEQAKNGLSPDQLNDLHNDALANAPQTPEPAPAQPSAPEVKPETPLPIEWSDIDWADKQELRFDLEKPAIEALKEIYKSDSAKLGLLNSFIQNNPNIDIYIGGPDPTNNLWSKIAIVGADNKALVFENLPEKFNYAELLSGGGSSVI